MKLYITGGGTGGHVTPGLAIARYFEKKQPQTTVRFAGSARGIENKLVPREGYPLVPAPQKRPAQQLLRRSGHVAAQRLQRIADALRIPAGPALRPGVPAS